MNIKSNAVKGFTLIEMMMVLSIAAILLTVAVPSYNTFSQNSKITKQVNLLAASVSAARGEAAKRGGRVVMCQSDSPTASNPECGGSSASGTWTNGWIVFVDADGNGDRDTSVGPPIPEPVVGAFQTENGVIIKTTAGETLSFNPDGTTTGGAVEYYVCDTRGVNYGKQLDIAGTGRPSTDDATSCG